MGPIVTPSMVLEFFTQPEPRAIPRAVWRAAVRHRPLRILRWMGLGFLVIGLIFMAVFQVWRLPIELCLDLGGGRQADGDLIAWNKTAFRVDASDHDPGIPIFRLVARFAAEDGVEREADGYTTGADRLPGGWEAAAAQPSGNDPVWLTETHSVTVEYLSWWPEQARVAETRLTPTGYFGGLVSVFALAGLVMLAFVWRDRRNMRRLLRRGLFASGRVEEVEPTGTVINGRPVFSARLSYVDAGGIARQARCRVCHTAADRCKEWREARTGIGLIYLPERPDKAFILDFLLTD